MADYYPGTETTEETPRLENNRKHTPRLGIVSFVMTLFLGPLVFAAAFGIYAAADTTSCVPARYVCYALLFGACLFLSLVSLGLGIGGICQPETEKVYAVLGTVLSGIIVAAAAAILVVGALCF